MDLKAKVLLDFIDYLISKKITFGQNVINCLNNQSDQYPNMPYTTDVLLKTTNSLNDSEQAAMTGDKVAIEKRNTMVALWNDQFRATANFISLQCNGSVEQIIATGFLPSKTTRQKKTRVANLHNFKVSVQNEKGTAYVSCDRAKTANGYIIIAAPDSVKINKAGDDMIINVNGTQVFLKTVTQSSATFTGLQSEQRVNLSMFAFNAAGSSSLTDAQSVLPQ